MFSLSAPSALADARLERTRWPASRTQAALNTWQLMFPQCSNRKVPRGTAVFQQGTSAATTDVLRRGLVKLLTILPDGTEAIEAIRFPGQVLQWPQPWGRSLCHSTSAVALTECDILCVPTKTFTAQFETDPFCAFCVHNVLSALHLAYSQLLEVKAVSLRDRLKKVLHGQKLATYGCQSVIAGRFYVLLTNEELAQLLGISVRHLRRLRKDAGRARSKPMPKG
jgi:CRP-like cAMP-binding protein